LVGTVSVHLANPDSNSHQAGFSEIFSWKNSLHTLNTRESTGEYNVRGFPVQLTLSILFKVSE
jgi:hypothetical protein